MKKWGTDFVGVPPRRSDEHAVGALPVEFGCLRMACISVAGGHHASVAQAPVFIGLVSVFFRDCARTI